jgi:exopolyphosphatase/guanosine-5'-triphosphate,3'-diphosphate pyrophosphatase
MKFAAIDIGTNTTRLAIVENNPFKVLSKYRAVTRLGEGFSKELIPKAQKRVIDVLKNYADIIKTFNVSHTAGVATSVVREASNGKEFVEKIFKETGIEIEIIDGEKEAFLTLKGVMSVLDSNIENFMLLDIGGGSNEFSLIKKGKLVDSISLKFGVVFLYEKFIGHNPPESGEIEQMQEEIRNNVLKIKEKFKIEKISDFHFVGTAGTVTTLSAINLGLKNYLPEKINNNRINKNFLEFVLKDMLKLTNKQRGEKYFIEKGREDVIISGMFIIKEAMEIFGFREIVSIDASLLEGVAINMIEKSI